MTCIRIASGAALTETQGPDGSCGCRHSSGRPGPGSSAPWEPTSGVFLFFIALYSTPTFDVVTNVVEMGGIAIGAIPLFLNRQEDLADGGDERHLKTDVLFSSVRLERNHNPILTGVKDGPLWPDVMVELGE